MQDNDRSRLGMLNEINGSLMNDNSDNSFNGA